MRNFFEGAAGLGIVLLMLAFGIFTIGAGWAGIEHAYGWGWGVAAAILGLAFRFTLPLTYGVFIFARDVWDWHWAAALLLAAPGVAFMIPGLIAAAIAAFKRQH